MIRYSNCLFWLNLSADLRTNIFTLIKANFALYYILQVSQRIRNMTVANPRPVWLKPPLLQDRPAAAQTAVVCLRRSCIWRDVYLILVSTLPKSVIRFRFWTVTLGTPEINVFVGSFWLV